MRLSRFSTSTAFALALVSLVPVVGCALEGEGDDGVELGSHSHSQAIGVGDAVSGLRAAGEVLSMLRAYQKYGELEVSTEMIFDKLAKVQTDVTALKDAVSDLQTAVAASHKDILNLPALSKTNEIYALMEGYRTAAASSDSAAKAKFLDALAKNQASQGTLKWADLVTLNDVIVGKNGSSSLLTLMMQAAAAKGTAEVDSDPVGRFITEKKLVQEEAFFLLTEASAKDPSVNLAQQKAAHEARMVEQDTAFIQATTAYTKLVLDAVVDARIANVQECWYDDGWFLGAKVWPDSGLHSFSDYDAAWKTDPTNPWFGKGVHGPDFTIGGRQACIDFRNGHVGRQVAKARTLQTEKLWAGQGTFTKFRLEQRGIAVESARYGVTAVTGSVGFACEAKTSCVFKVDTDVLGDFEQGVQKGFVVRYTCGTGTAVKEQSLAKEAHGSTVTLSCP